MSFAGKVWRLLVGIKDGLVLIAIGWFGFLSVRRLLGFEALEWSQVVSYLIAIPVLLVPRVFEYVWDRVGK